jgi:hypothetical protein
MMQDWTWRCGRCGKRIEPYESHDTENCTTSLIVAGYSSEISACDVAALRSRMQDLPMQEISFASKTDDSIADHRVETDQTADLAKVDLL